MNGKEELVCSPRASERWLDLERGLQESCAVEVESLMKWMWQLVPEEK